MKKGVETRVSEFMKEVKKFSGRWNQLKPGNDVIESGDPKRLSEAIKKIKEKKEEFKELIETKAALL